MITAKVSGQILWLDCSQMDMATHIPTQSLNVLKIKYTASVLTTSKNETA